MINLPHDFAVNPIRLADWMELSALTSPHRSCSAGDFQSVATDSGVLVPLPAEVLRRLRRPTRRPAARRGVPLGSRAARGADVPHFDTEFEAMEYVSQEAFWELRYRVRAGRGGYPFRVSGALLRAMPNWEDRIAYVFCLCLSYYGGSSELPDRVHAPRMFEHVAKEAAKAFIRGEAVRFGWPRQSGIDGDPSDLPTPFEDAIDELCNRIGEGNGFCPHEFEDPIYHQDAGVDIVAWRGFPDGRPGKLLLLGNCASGRNWGDKLGDLHEGRFRDLIKAGPYSPILKGFFVPHRIETLGASWAGYNRQGGIVFERCRIAKFARLPGWQTTYCTEWCTRVLEIASEGELE